MNIEAMKSAIIEESQLEMIDAYAEAVLEFDRPDGEEGFRSFCGMWKYENNCGHVSIPDYV
jgi:hypothetical protein